jgi:hypothetical protein
MSVTCDLVLYIAWKRSDNFRDGQPAVASLMGNPARKLCREMLSAEGRRFFPGRLSLHLESTANSPSYLDGQRMHIRRRHFDWELQCNG